MKEIFIFICIYFRTVYMWHLQYKTGNPLPQVSQLKHMETLFLAQKMIIIPILRSRQPVLSFVRKVSNSGKPSSSSSFTQSSEINWKFGQGQWILFMSSSASSPKCLELWESRIRKLEGWFIREAVDLKIGDLWFYSRTAFFIWLRLL